ncbi:MAG: hypothetical protein H6807_07535 [Planctomycetes bacterium]|nr:hypothetical protein [Planctomycetota bacterium]
MTPGRFRVLVVAMLMGLLVYRAAHQSFSHDEALSLFRISAAGWSSLVRANSVNTHLLNSAGMLVSRSAFGDSPLALRLPALLAGLLWLSLLAGLAGRELGGGWWASLVVLLPASNPYLLDFFCCARGYGPAVAFLLAALILVARTGGVKAGVGRLLLFDLCVLLGFAANLSFGFALLILDLLLALALLFEPGERPFGRRLARIFGLVVLPQAVGVIVLLLPFTDLLRSENLYYGAATWTAALDRSLALAFLHVDTADGFDDRLLEPLRSARPVLGALLALLVLMARPWRLCARDDAGPGPRLAPVAAAGLLGTVILAELAHRLLGQPLPLGRTALPLLVFSVILLAALAAGPAESKPGRLRRWLLLPVLTVLVLVQLRAQSGGHFAEWRWDSAAGGIYETIARERQDDEVFVLVLPFTHRPALDYLARRAGARWLRAIDAEPVPGRDYDFIVTTEPVARLPGIAEAIGEILFEDETSRVLVARPKPR